MNDTGRGSVSERRNVRNMPREVRKVALIYPVATFMPPLGLATLGAILERMGKTVAVVPMYPGQYVQGDQIFPGQLEELEAFGPEVIGIGFMSAERQAGREMLGILAARFPEAVLVAGGRHPSCFPQQVLEWGADFVVVGEGETAFAELIRALENAPGSFGEIQGVARLAPDGRMELRPRLEETADLDIVPAYHLIPYQRFIDMRSAVTGRYLKAGWLTTSRGCFSRCIYCRDANFGGRLRLRAMDAVEADMELQVGRYDLDSFYIIDDMFAVNERRVLEFCDRFEKLRARSGRHLQYAATARTDTLTKPMVDALARSGCTQLSIGVESGSQRVHDFLCTGKSVDTIVSAFDMLRGTDIDTFINLIVGVPIEEEQDMVLTARLLERIKPTTVGVTFLTAYPGTPLFGMAMEKGWLPGDAVDHACFQHSSGTVQLDFSVDAGVLLRRREALYSSTLYDTVGAILRRKREAMHLAMDTLASLMRSPQVVARMLKSLALGDVDGFKVLYRKNNFERINMPELMWACWAGKDVPRP